MQHANHHGAAAPGFAARELTDPKARKPPARGANAEETERDPTSITDLSAERKAFLTLQANAALAGFELLQMADGTFAVGRWGMLRRLATLDDAAAFLARVGVKA